MHFLSMRLRRFYSTFFIVSIITIQGATPAILESIGAALDTVLTDVGVSSARRRERAKELFVQAIKLADPGVEQLVEAQWSAKASTIIAPMVIMVLTMDLYTDEDTACCNAIFSQLLERLADTMPATFELVYKREQTEMHGSCEPYTIFPTRLLAMLWFWFASVDNSGRGRALRGAMYSKKGFYESMMRFMHVLIVHGAAPEREFNEPTALAINAAYRSLYQCLNDANEHQYQFWEGTIKQIENWRMEYLQFHMKVSDASASRALIRPRGMAAAEWRVSSTKGPRLFNGRSAVKRRMR